MVVINDQMGRVNRFWTGTARNLDSQKETTNHITKFQSVPIGLDIKLYLTNTDVCLQQSNITIYCMLAYLKLILQAFNLKATNFIINSRRITIEILSVQ